jgi:hypothetical protein
LKSIPVYALSAEAAMADMQIFVKTGALPHGVVHGPITMTVDDVKPSDTIAKVKAKIQALTAFPATEQHLFLGRQELDSLRTLADYDIQNKSTLHITVGALKAQRTLPLRAMTGFHMLELEARRPSR